MGSYGRYHKLVVHTFTSFSLSKNVSWAGPPVSCAVSFDWAKQRCKVVRHCRVHGLAVPQCCTVLQHTVTCCAAVCSSRPNCLVAVRRGAQVQFWEGKCGKAAESSSHASNSFQAPVLFLPPPSAPLSLSLKCCKWKAVQFSLVQRLRSR